MGETDFSGLHILLYSSYSIHTVVGEIIRQNKIFRPEKSVSPIDYKISKSVNYYSPFCLFSCFNKGNSFNPKRMK